MTTYFSAKELLQPPTERAAFSDRQAYVCAELSKLAYFKFEGGHTLQQALDIVRVVMKDDQRLAVLEEQLRLVLSGAPSSGAEGTAALGSILAEVGFTLVQTFSVEGTQAYFCTRNLKMEFGTEKTLAYLVFRGTEPKDFRDIKSDISAALRKFELDGEVLQFHTGYLDAFELVRKEIEQVLEQTSFDQLFIAGHSLGGALAIVTTRILAPDGHGACYTFGAPPVGAVEIQDNLKTPVYEIINEVDIVPRLPNPWAVWFIHLLFRILRLVGKLVTVLNQLFASGTWDERLEAFIDSMTKYRHPGYMSYLVGRGNAARLRYNVSGFDRLRWWATMVSKSGFLGFSKMVTDHSIDEYISKLKVHALGRQ